MSWIRRRGRRSEGSSVGYEALGLVDDRGNAVGD